METTFPPQMQTHSTTTNWMKQLIIGMVCAMLAIVALLGVLYILSGGDKKQQMSQQQKRQAQRRL